MKMPIKNNAICKAALVLAIGSLALDASADPTIVTQTVDGVKWALTLDTSGKTAIAGYDSEYVKVFGTSYSKCCTIRGTCPSVLSIPSSFTIEGDEYVVNEIGNRSFYNCDDLTDVVIPSAVGKIDNYAFHHCDNLKNVCLKGPVTVGNGQAQTYVTLARDAYVFGSATQTRNIKLVLMGPNIKKGSSDNNLIAAGATNMTVLLPKRSDNSTWSAFDTSSKVGSGENNTVKFYGPGEEFDLKMYETSVTIVPTTAAALADALAWAPTFKSGFGLDTHISIANAIDTAIDVSEHPGVTFDTQAWQKFKVSSQAQLDETLAAVSTDSSIIVDATDATEDIVIPEGRRVAVIVPPGWTFWRQMRGLVLTFK